MYYVLVGILAFQPIKNIVITLKLLILVMLKIRLCCIIFFSLSFYLGYSCPGIPQFTLPTTWCVNSPVTFNNTSTNSPQSYTWSFGDASAAVTVTNDNDQTHTYTAPGNYQIKLIITFSNGCIDSVMNSITIVANTLAPPSFNFSPNNGCANVPVNFTNTTPNPGSLTFNWNFGDPASGGDNTENTENSIHEFTATGSGGSIPYSVTLTSTNNTGCSNSSSQTVTIVKKPDATLLDSNIFSAFSNCGNPNLTPASPVYHIAVQNGSSTLAANANYTISWGDGSPNFSGATFTQASHDFLGLGIFTITLTINGTNGCVATESYQVFNLTNPSVGIGSPGSTVGCAPFTLTFPVTLDSVNLNYTTYRFNFDDGTPEVLWTPPAVFTSISHTFEAPSCGRLGNQYTVKVTAKNVCDSTQATVNNIKISSKPTAKFTASPTPGCVNVPVTFTNLTTPGCNAINGSTVTTFVWNYGDGTGNTVANTSFLSTSHTYTATGTYNVSLTATSSCGPSTFTLAVNILGPPTAKFTITPPACAPVTINTTNQSTGDSLSYNWNAIPAGWLYTGGTDANDLNPRFLFSAGGTYTITLTTTNPCGVSIDDTIITIKSVPIVTLNSIPGGCQPYVVTPSATYNAGGGTISAYAWTFTGGAPTSSTSDIAPSITYTAASDYTVTIRATNECGFSTATQSFSVSPQPSANAGSNTSVCGGSPAQIGSASVVGLTYSWSSIPAGFSSAVSDPTVNPTVTTNFVVNVSNGLCSTNDTVEVAVNPAPTVVVSPNQTACIDASDITLSGTPIGGTWSGTGVTAGGVFSPSTSGDGAYSLTYSYTDAGTTCSSSGTVNVTVIALPIVSAGADISECNQPGTTTYIGSPAGGTWTGPGITAAGVYTPSTAGNGTHELIYSFTDGNSCSNKDTMLVTVQDPSAVNAGDNDTLCLNAGALTLTGFTPAGGTWTGTGVDAAGLFTPSIATVGTYILTYTFGVGTCLTTATKVVVVKPLPIVVAGLDQTTCISSSAFSLTGFSPAGGTWSGTGVDVAGTFTPLTAGVGVHTLTYTYADPIINCSDSRTKTVVVGALPAVNFSLPATSCINNPIVFTNSTTGASIFAWSFGDGGTDVLENPSHIYTATGTYIVELIATSIIGCKDSIEQTIQLTAPPIANFSTTPDSGCAPLSVSFVNGSSGDFISFIWDLGNGTTVTDTTPVAQVYQQVLYDTTYYISLTVTNQCASVGYFDSVVVNPIPVVDFGTNLNEGCSPFTPLFNNISTGNSDVYTWNFGDGGPTSNLVNPNNHTFFTGDSDTTFIVILIGVNECGSDTMSHPIVVHPNTVTAFFNTSTTSGCAPHTVSFTNYSTGGTFITWNFGDGNTSTQTSPTHTYLAAGTYTCYQYVNNSCSYDTTSMLITVNPPPSLSFTPSPIIKCANQPITFNNISVDAVNFDWYFGDGDSSNLVSPSHSFDTSGVYTVMLIGTSTTFGCRDTTTLNVNINSLPIPQFVTNVSFGCMPLPISFTNNSSNSNFYTWNFGDGNTSVQTNPSHAYPNQGIYTITLVAENLNGCKDSITRQVNVYPKPVASFAMSSQYSCNFPVDVNMINNSTGADAYQWDLGNGTTTAINNPQANYTANGPYTISLIASNSFGCLDSTTQVYNVYSTPVVNFIPSAVLGCEAFGVTFSNETQDGNTYSWTFTDGGTSTDSSPSHVFQDSGVYGVTLIATSFETCVDTLIMNNLITVNPSPTSDFGYNQLYSEGIPNGGIQFLNMSEGAISYIWNFGDGAGTNTETHPEHQFLSIDIYNVTLISENQFQCRDTIVKPVKVDYFQGLFVPNAFVPNSAYEDLRYFIPKGKTLKEYKLQVFNTWGTLIFESDKLDGTGAPVEGWDGTYLGEPCAQDVYVWKVEAIFRNDEVWLGKEYLEREIKNTGTVTLLR